MPGRQRAQAIAELALVVPLWMLILAGAIEFGRVFFSYGQLRQAAFEGARYGAVLQHRADAEIIARVRQVSPGGVADTVQVSTTTSPTNNATVTAANRTIGNVLSVTVQHTANVPVPFFPVPPFSMTATVDMVVEKTPQ